VADVLNYEVVTKVTNAQALQHWLAMEGVRQYQTERTGDQVVRFKFVNLDDAFRFRLTWDEQVVAA
jgi:uncharacterized protein YkuJ